jgi:hypothetical protein
MYKSARGMDWDPLQKKWVMYNLCEEAQRVLNEEAEGSATGVLCGVVDSLHQDA